MSRCNIIFFFISVLYIFNGNKASQAAVLSGDFAVKENEAFLKLSCSSDPPISSGEGIFLFYWNGMEVTDHNNTISTYEKDVKSSDNGSVVQCRVNETDYSQNETVIVYWQPQIKSVNVSDPSNLIIKNNNQILIRSDQSLSMNCDVDSNPPANCLWILKPDEIISNKCKFTAKLKRSGFIQCQATNHMYPFSDPEIETFNVTLVEEKRIPKVFDTSNSTHDANEFDVIENGSLTLECRVDFQDELGATFNWTLKDQLLSTENKLELNVINTTLDGDYYHCHTKDDFGENSKQFSVNVLFSPRKSKSSDTGDVMAKNISCTWIDGSDEECRIELYSNPPAEGFNLTKNNTGVDGFTFSWRHTEDEKQTITIRKYKVSESDEGNYALDVTSYSFPNDNLVIGFEITVEPPSNSKKIIIISCCCVGAVIIILIGLFVWYRMRIKQPKEKTSKKVEDEDIYETIDTYPVSQQKPDEKQPYYENRGTILS